MLIANPIYDVVFKYLMEDTDIAKGLLSIIIEEEIVELTLQPQEYTGKLAQYDIIIFRLDFRAVIKTASGIHKTVLIELQKSKNLTDIIRFRRYLGANYQKEDEIKEGELVNKVPLPIIPIYFLGFRLKHVPTPIVRVSRQYKDLVYNRIIDAEEEFIEKLTHDSIIIQIPRLRQKVQTTLEWVLSIFNQAYITKDRKVLELPTKELPQNTLLTKITTRLGQAALKAEVIRGIQIEEEVGALIESHIREKVEAKEQVQKVLNTNKVLQEENKSLEEDKKVLQDEKKALEKEKLSLEEKYKAELEAQRLRFEEMLKQFKDKPDD